MYKICQFPGIDPHSGNATVQLITPGDVQSLEKTASILHPEVRHYVANLKPEPHKVYVLIIALGAGEYYGSNINGDHFPLPGLTHEGNDYGYRTFLNGHTFKHHQNKNPATSFGSIPVSAWNDTMKRVDLILELDRRRAHQFEADDIIEKIEAGIPIAVSMGCKVNYDVCSICGNKAKFRKDYCFHLQYEMNKIYPDGRRVCAYNPFPRFFDLSFVFIGADKIAKTLCKLASQGTCEICEIVKATKVAQVTEQGHGGECCGTEVCSCETKTASIKDAATKSAVDKKSDIIKDVPSTFTKRTVPMLCDSESSLPRQLLNHMGTLPLNQALATPSYMGMVLKPREYQRIVLVRMGRTGTADKLDSRGEVFQHSDKTDSTIPLAGFLPSLFRKILPFMADRSGFGPFLNKRLIRITISRPEPQMAEKTSAEAFLEKIAQGYNGYRLQLLSHMPHDLPGVIDRNPELNEALFGDQFADFFSKEAATGGTVLKPLLGIFPVLYYLSAHWRDQEIHGRQLGFVKKFVVENPGLSSLLLAGATSQLKRS